MIRLITGDTINSLQSFCTQIEQTPFSKQIPSAKQTPFACKILSTANAYGTELPFAQFWLQFSVNETPVAAISRLDDVLTLCTTQDSDYEELKDFVNILGVKSVLCDFSAAQAMNLPIAQRGETMLYRNEIPLIEQDQENCLNLEEVHKLLCACKTDSFTPPEFEPFYLDMSHRVRHNTARVVGVRRDGQLIACAMATAQTQQSAVISAVATHPNYQRQGFGRQAVRALISQLPQKELFVFRAQYENAAFYRSLGFEPYGEWAESHL